MSNEKRDTENRQTEQDASKAEAKKNESAEKKECHGCVDCPHTGESHKPCKRLKWKYSMKCWVFWLVGIVCVVGLIGAWWGQYVAPEESRLQVTLEIWNQYVGIVLGVVATLLSIVSLVFSFHNEEEENIQQRNYDEKFGALTSSVADLKAELEKYNSTLKEVNSALTNINSRLAVFEGQRNNTTAKSKTDGNEIEENSVD